MVRFSQRCGAAAVPVLDPGGVATLLGRPGRPLEGVTTAALGAANKAALLEPPGRDPSCLTVPEGSSRSASGRRHDAAGASRSRSELLHDPRGVVQIGLWKASRRGWSLQVAIRSGATTAALGAANKAARLDRPRGDPRCVAVPDGSSRPAPGREPPGRDPEGCHDRCLGRSQQGSAARSSRSRSGLRHGRRWIIVQVDLWKASRRDWSLQVAIRRGCHDRCLGRSQQGSAARSSRSR